MNVFQWIKNKLNKRAYNPTTQPFYVPNVSYFNQQIDNIVLTALGFYTNPIKELPLKIYLDGQELKSHRLLNTLNDPSDRFSRSVFYSRLLYNMLYSGESFALILPSGKLWLYWETGDMVSYEDKNGRAVSKECMFLLNV